jgi:hypothetical protein
MSTAQRMKELDERLKQMRRYCGTLAQTLQQWDEQGAICGHFCRLIESTEMNAAKTSRQRPERSKK